MLAVLEAGAVRLTATMAESLFVSLASDTGWFQFPSVTPEVFRLAGRLQELGANPQAIYEHLFQSESRAKMRLLALALPTLTVCPEGDLASFHISREMFRQAGAEPYDTENLINEAQRIEGVVASILCVEQDPEVIKVSLRSKHDVDMAQVAMTLGGGGHARAAGCTLRMPLGEARKAVLAAVRKAMGRS
jgi:phosphoesterase RecJ-like protein